MGDLGFILQPTYRIERGASGKGTSGGARAVVYLYGVLEGGDSFLVRDTRERSSFFIRDSDAPRAAKLGTERIEDSDWTTWDGHAARLVEVETPPDTPALRDRLEAHGVRCYEADVRFAVRYLWRRGLRGSLEIEGEWRKGQGSYRGVDRVYTDPELRPASYTPRLTVLSIDIETDPTASRLLSIGLFGPGVAEVLLHCPPGEDGEPLEAPSGSVRLLRERDLLTTLVRRVRQIDPDVLTGWNFVDFDLRVLDVLARRHGVRLELGRGRGALRLRKTPQPWSSLEATVPGRLVLDGIHLLRGAFVKMESYALGHVAKEVLGEGKLIEGSNRGQEILDSFYHDRRKLVDYNLADARLVLDILDKLQLIELAVERSRLTGLAIDRVSGSIAAFDFLYLEELSRRRIAAPSVGHAGPGRADLGGHVLEPEPGLWKNVLVCDFKSLYPSLIRTFQIDPLGFLADPSPGEDPIRAPNGACFRREPGILPAMLDVLFPRREAAKRAGDRVASHAIKILMNSFYGVLGTSACRFYRPKLAGSITAFGREILLWSKARIEGYGHRVLYGDTDSLFVLSGTDDPLESRRLGEELVERLDTDLGAHIRERWGVESKLELEFEKLYLECLLQALRGGKGGARKRYAGLVDDGNGKAGRVELTGLEAVRRDWTELAKAVQQQLYEGLFHHRDVSAYLRRTVEEVRRGEHDGQLVYVKALRKPLAEYTATTPPHVAAARKQRKPPRRLVRYVMTVAGPEPAQERRNRLDHEHYVQKQIRPVAEPVLQVLGLDFDKVVGDDAQLTLF
ncbi:MAG: DNA polymerase II [Holophagales bacterium]|nr:DNA polymerase II [Holophagales bacterium]